MDILAELDVLGLLSGLNLVADNLVSYLEGIKWNLPDTYYEKIDSNRITRVQYYNGKQYLASCRIVRSYSADLLIEQKPGWKMEKQLSYGFPSGEDDEVIIRVTNKHNRWV